MRLRATLFHIATMVSSVTACSSGGTGALAQPGDGGGPGTDGGPTTKDAGPDGTVVGCGGCNCGSPATTQGTASPSQACSIMAGGVGFEGGCQAYCGSLPGNTKNATYYCSVATDYQQAYLSLQPEAGASLDAGADADAGLTCPAWSNDVVVTCGYPCLGRRTDGIADPKSCDPAELGEVFANRAYLEAVSVHAFARLERELAFYGAPASLVHAARRARREEVRHTAVTMRLARRFGTEASLPEAPTPTPVRTLFEIARENAVEGCVRETYGAVMGLLEAQTSSDAEVRAESRRIADDECRHAELALAVAHWIEPLLTGMERAAIQAAVGEAIADLRARGDARVVELLDAEVWAKAA